MNAPKLDRIVVQLDSSCTHSGGRERRGRTLTGRLGTLIASGLILASGLVVSVSLLSGSSSSASVASTQHEHPNSGVAGVDVLCTSSDYSCTPGYTGSNATGWAWTFYGCPNYASGCGVGTPHNCTLYAAFRLMQNGYANPGWSGNANQWAVEASRHGVLVNQTPAVGAIAEWNSGDGGHVAYVEASTSGGITLTMDDWYDAAPYPNGYTREVHIAPGSPAWPDNFIHFKDQGGSSQTPSTPAAPQGGHVVSVVNAAGGVYWRSGTDWNTPVRVSGTGVYNGDQVALLCWQRGAADTPPYYNNPLWYQAAVVQGQGRGQGWVNDHFLATGTDLPNIPVVGVPACSTASTAAQATSNPQPAAGASQLQPAAGASQLQPAAGASQLQSGAGSVQLQSPSVQGASGATTGGASVSPAPATTSTSDPAPETNLPQPASFAETVGSVAHTWTDYGDAGGTEGPSIGGNQTVQIACKVTGFAVADGNKWWYRIASAPWSGTYYVSADAFYNDGATSGSLSGTPFVDPDVPGC